MSAVAVMVVVSTVGRRLGLVRAHGVGLDVDTAAGTVCSGGRAGQ